MGRVEASVVVCSPLRPPRPCYPGSTQKFQRWHGTNAGAVGGWCDARSDAVHVFLSNYYFFLASTFVPKIAKMHWLLMADESLHRTNHKCFTPPPPGGDDP